MIDNRVLADTSAWIEFLNNSAHPVNALMENLIEESRLCVASVVKAELLRGASSESECVDIEAFWRDLPLLETSDKVWNEAGRLAFRLRRKGITPGLIDTYLASLALANKISFLTLDKGFVEIAKHSALKLEPLK